MRRLFIMRKDLNMSPGKLAAQVGHCAEAYWTKIILDGAFSGELFSKDKDRMMITISVERDIVSGYINDSFVKTVCEARNKNHLLKAKTMADDMGLVEGEDYGLIFDNCITELEPEEENGTTLTGIWFKPLPDEDAHKISRKYQLYK